MDGRQESRDSLVMKAGPGRGGGPTAVCVDRGLRKIRVLSPYGDFSSVRARDEESFTPKRHVRAAHAAYSGCCRGFLRVAPAPDLFARFPVILFFQSKYRLVDDTIISVQWMN